MDQGPGLGEVHRDTRFTPGRAGLPAPRNPLRIPPGPRNPLRIPPGPRGPLRTHRPSHRPLDGLDTLRDHFNRGLPNHGVPPHNDHPLVPDPFPVLPNVHPYPDPHVPVRPLVDPHYPIDVNPRKYGKRPDRYGRRSRKNKKNKRKLQKKIRKALKKQKKMQKKMQKKALRKHLKKQRKIKKAKRRLEKHAMELRRLQKGYGK